MVCLWGVLSLGVPLLLLFKCQTYTDIMSGRLLVLHFLIRAPNDARFAHLLHTRTKIHPLQVYPVHGMDPLN